ncbi:hypothetical protein BC834DRAFT_536227 [Gloeopeniophorella convolvens]|nr:hypothetical protein BC834DRAFT_536227 [Gloeopeniophorella convolvens]
MMSFAEERLERDAAGHDDDDDPAEASGGASELSGEGQASQGQYGNIDALPDDILLAIFDCVRHASYSSASPNTRHSWGWQTLALVSRRWRAAVLAAPHHLGLAVFCTHDRPVRDMVRWWPSFPVHIAYGGPLSSDDIVSISAALHHPARVASIQLGVTHALLPALAPLLAAAPFPALAALELDAPPRETLLAPPVLALEPTPALRTLDLCGVALVALPRLLTSAPDLTTLTLEDIPSVALVLAPDALAACLAATPALARLALHFPPNDAAAHLRSTAPPPPQRIALPALRRMSFRGAAAYAEDLFARLAPPQLARCAVRLRNQLALDVPQLACFVTQHTALGPLVDSAALCLLPDRVTLQLSASDEAHTLQQPGDEDETETVPRGLRVSVTCRPLDWQVSVAAQLCTQLAARVPHANFLLASSQSPREDVEQQGWEELLRAFTGAETFALNDEALGALSEVLQSAQALNPARSGVLPALRKLEYLALQSRRSLSGFDMGLEAFIAARGLSTPIEAILPILK